MRLWLVAGPLLVVLAACGSDGAPEEGDFFTQGPITSELQLAPPDEGGPTIDDHWHHAYGFYLCDRWVTLDGDAEERDSNGRPTNVAYMRTGVHSHDDGLIHWHPFSSASYGDRARLGVFLDVYDVRLTDDLLEFPPSQQSGARFAEDETTCDGDTAELSVRVGSIDPDADVSLVDDGFTDLRLDRDAMTIAIVFAPSGVDPGRPPSTDDFADNVVNDMNVLSDDLLFPGTSQPAGTLQPDL